jgi:predicted small secreted protein
MKTNKKLIFIMSLLFGFLGACNTVGGMGEDIQAGGHGISKAATDVFK